MTNVGGIVPRYLAAVCHEVVAVLVAGIAIAVSIHRRALCLASVGPHVGGKVGMGVHHAVVEHGDDDRRVASARLPCLDDIDVAACLCSGVVIVKALEIVVSLAKVVVVPLMGKAWVGGERRGARCGYWLEHALADIDAATVGSGAFESAVGLHFGHLAKLLETAHGLAEVGVGVKLDGVPEMKSRGACLCAAIDGEDPFEAVAAEDVEHLVGRRDARTCGLARARQLQLAVEDLGHLVGELDEQLARCGVGRDDNIGVGDVGVGFEGGERAIGAACQRHGKYCYMKYVSVHYLIICRDYCIVLDQCPFASEPLSSTSPAATKMR